MLRIIKAIIAYWRGYIYILVGLFKKRDVNKVLFFTFQGRYACNPKYICEALLKINPNTNVVWVATNEKDIFPRYVDVVSYGSWAYYNALYTSKVLIENALNFDKRPYLKKRDQYCIQTMHGSFGLKRIDENAVKRRRRNSRGRRSAKNSDYIISNSTCESGIYRTSFWNNTPILQIGHARNDILLKTDDNLVIKNRLTKRFGIEDEDVKFCLYAPTYVREYTWQFDHLNYELLREVLQERFGGTWYIIIRLHPRDIRKVSMDETPKYVLNGNWLDDLYGLLPAIEFGITDYSSWICDFALTKRPGALYVPDVEEYAEDVGFIYPLTDTPYIIARTNIDLVNGIREFKQPCFEEKAEEYLNDKGCVDDGNASIKAARIIFNLMSDDDALANEMAI